MDGHKVVGIFNACRRIVISNYAILQRITCDQVSDSALSSALHKLDSPACFGASRSLFHAADYDPEGVIRMTASHAKNSFRQPPITPQPEYTRWDVPTALFVSSMFKVPSRPKVDGRSNTQSPILISIRPKPSKQPCTSRNMKARHR